MESSVNEDLDFSDYEDPLNRSDSEDKDEAPEASEPSSTTQDVPPDAEIREASDSDPKCAICLQPYQNKSMLDRCFHAFCFSCIMTWSSREKWCPLCKTPFTSLIYNIQNAKLFDQHYFAKKEEVAKNQKRPSPSRNAPILNRLSGVERRRSVYANRLYVRPETDTRLVVRERQLTPASLKGNSIMMSRMEGWVSREVMAIVGESHHLVVHTYIMSLVTRMDITSPVFATLLRPFLLDNTAHFVHELLNFARSPLDIQGYDRRAQYDDQPVTDRLSKTEVKELDPSNRVREKTPPHMQDYARAIRHMMNVAHREGQEIEPIADRNDGTPPPETLTVMAPRSSSPAPPDEVMTRARSRSPIIKDRRDEELSHRHSGRKHGSRSRKENKHKHHKDRHRHPSPPQQQRQSYHDQEVIDVDSEWTTDNARSSGKILRNASPPIKRKASPAKGKPRRERSVSPITRPPTSPNANLDNDEGNNQTSLSDLHRELAEVEATLARDRMELASLLLRRELRK